MVRFLDHSSPSAILRAERILEWTHGTPAGGGGVGVLDTRTLNNSSASATASEFVADTMGLTFKRGDIPSGQWPVLQTTGGTNIPYSAGLARTWSDGSLKFLSVLPRIGSSISGNGSLTVNILSGGSAPSASSRTLTEVAAAQIQVEVVGDSGLSGTWTCDLAAAISDAVEINVTHDGPAGKCWTIRGNFKQGGSAHGQLVAYFYVQALQNASGALAGFRVLPLTTLPWYNQVSPTQARLIFSSFTLKYGSGPTVYDPVGAYISPFTATWSGTTAGGNNNDGTTADSVYAPGVYPNQSMCLKYSTTGTAMGGLTNGAHYWVGYCSNTDYVRILSTPANPNNDGFIQAITSAGTGTHTFTPMNDVGIYGGSFIAGLDARYTFIRDAGSYSADHTTFWNRDGAAKAYLRSTQLIPPLDMTIGTVSAASTPIPWSPWTVSNQRGGFTGSLTLYLDTTGESAQIGPLHNSQVRHFHAQSRNDEMLVREMGFAQIKLCQHQRDVTTGGLANWHDPGKSYTGMPASVHASGGPASSAGSGQGFSTVYMSHMPQLTYYAYLVTGEPQFLDMLAVAGNNPMQNANGNSGDRAKTIGGTTYYGLVSSGRDSLRTAGWGERDVFLTAGILPDVSPDGRAIGQYFSDVAASNAAFMVALYNSRNSWWQDNGFWWPMNCPNGRSSWQMGYHIFAVCFGAALTEDSNCMTLLQNYVKWPVKVQADFGGPYNLCCYYERSSSDYHGDDTSYQADTTPISSDAEWMSAGSETSLSWDSGTGLFTQHWGDNGFAHYTCANGDKYSFPKTIPGGFTASTVYYAVGVSGSTFGLSETLGGSPIAPTDTSVPAGVYALPVSPPAADSYGGFTSADSYLANNRGAYSWAKALGADITGLDTVLSAISGRLTSVDFSAYPKYAMQDSF